MTVKTSLKRELIDFLSYQADDTGITLTSDVSIVAGESFIFTFDQNVQNGNRVVNARPLRKTAIIPAQRRRIAIGSTIEVAPSIINADGIDSQQIGNIQVFAEGLILFRNAGNVAGDILTSGNYREVFLDNVTDAGIEAANVVNNGTANAIELNVALTQEADVMIISTNLIVDSTTNTISLLTNEAATKLNELPTLDAANAGRFLTVNSAGDAYQLSAASSPLGIIQVDTFEDVTSNTAYTYNIPDDAVSLEVEAAGAGANGGNGSSVFAFPSFIITGGTGGQGAQHDTRFIPLTAGTGRTLAVTLGTSGANTTLIGTDITDQTWLGNYEPVNTFPTTSASGETGARGSASRGRAGVGGPPADSLSAGGGGGGGGWVEGNIGGSNSGNGTGGAGGHGGMVIKALAATVNIRS